MIVIDTNIVLDLFVFKDPLAQPLGQVLAAKELQWIATPDMRDELARVLDYPKIAARLARHDLAAIGVLALFDAHVQLREAATKAPLTCRDPDDQKFIDLAVAHKARLLSKDRAVLCMSKRLLAHGVVAQGAMVFVV